MLGLLACNRYEDDVVPVRKAGRNKLNDDTYGIYLNQPLRLNVLANDTIILDGELVFGQPAHGKISTDAAGFLYQPDQNFKGLEEFYYKYCSGPICDSALVSVTVLPAVPNCNLRANPDQAYFNAANPVTIPVLANDITCGPVAISSVGQPKHGSIAVLPNNQLQYTPVNGFAGYDSLTYEIQAPDGRRASALVVVAGSMNCTLVARPDVANTNLNDSITLYPVRNDVICGSPVTISIVSNPQHGAVQVLANNGLAYEPAFNFSGTDVFTYQICNAANQCAQGTITINTQATVNCVTGFTARNDSLSFPAGAAASGVYLDVLLNDIYCLNQLTSVTILQPPAQGTVTVVSQNGIPQLHYVKFAGGSAPFTEVLRYQVCMLVNGQNVCKSANVKLNFY